MSYGGLIKSRDLEFARVIIFVSLFQVSQDKKQLLNTYVIQIVN